MNLNRLLVSVLVAGGCSGQIGGGASTSSSAEVSKQSVSSVDAALAYGESLVGTPYGWWLGGPLPEGEPMFTASGPVPDSVGSVNCSGLMNLLLRSVGRDPIGGTAAYYDTFYSVSEWFVAGTAYPPGTLLIRNYRDVSDQGHVAVVNGQGMLLQSFASCAGCSDPGVTDAWSVDASNGWGGASNYFELAVRPENWLGGTSLCPNGDGYYCGGDGIEGDPDILYWCEGGHRSIVQSCALGCKVTAPGLPDACNTDCPSGDGLYCGGNTIGGDSDTLYRCAKGQLTVVEKCAGGCTANPSGVDDACR